jgi:transcriptional regulator GlxA family with amidase domain
MEFADQRRLRHARELLQHPDAGTTVAATALACGFTNLSRFEIDYILAFGEPPSATLQSRQGRGLH